MRYNLPVPAVSVLLPCCNAAATLPACLDSLASQTLTDIEIILVDDGSTDATADLLRERARRDARFRGVSQPHGGIIPALNRGLAACSAPLVARMDADDLCHPTRLEKQSALLAARPELAAAGCLVRGFPPEEVRAGFAIYLDWLNALTEPAEIAREIFIESPLPHPSVMLRRVWLEQAGGYQDHGWAEDYDLWLRLHLAGAQFAKVPETLLDWRESPARLTRTDSRYALENFLRAKAHYLMRGPLRGRDAVIIWGAGMVGRRIGKHLLREGAPLAAFIDIDPRKIGRTRRGKPILPAEALPAEWSRHAHPVLLAAVGARGARALIRARLTALGLVEGADWWGVA
jgi:glycosyltransferase involved in cell wall biosynthesis